MELNGMLVVVSSVTKYGNNELGDAIDCVIKYFHVGRDDLVHG